MRNNIDFKDIKKESFDDFIVHYYSDNYCFIHIEIKDTNNFYENLFEYFFNQDRLIRYAEAKMNIKFNKTKREYTTLYKHLDMYIDDFNEEKEFENLDKDITEILLNEGMLEDEKGKLNVRLDKIGKIGEYMFSCLLNEYFEYDCIIPKIHLTTDPNMSVYGIDTLFYDSLKSEILFGESKFSKSLENGLKLIKKSLESYEVQIRDEYKLILSNRLLKDKLNIFNEKYGEYTEVCLDIDEFIREAKIDSIGIPIFIAYGGIYNAKDVLRKLMNIKNNNLLGIKTNYYCISLPIIDKEKFVKIIVLKIKKRMKVYCDERRKCY